MDALRYANVSGYGNDYSVFEDGRVWSNKGFRFLKQQRQLKRNGKYYVYVKLCRHGKATKHYIHRLVATSFLPNPENKATVNHKNGDSENNLLSNLEWSTMQEQVDHAWSTNLTNTSGEKCKTSKLTTRQVVEILALYQAGESQAQLSRSFGVGTSQINRIVNGTSWHRKGA